MLNGVGDILDLDQIYQKKVDFDSMTLDEIRQYVFKNGHCSALVKVPGDLSDIWSSHSAWFTYSAMNRIYKHYSFNFHNEYIASLKLSFSSYPGLLSSLDDFYIMSNGLVLLQTTISVFNKSLYDLVVPESLLAWQRVRAANFAARDGKQWGDIINYFNSGTYNNQYMVVDYNKFEVGKTLNPGTLWVTEQMPGLVVSVDMTDILERGYWASYNVPALKEIYEGCGYPDFVKKHGIEYSYQMSPRAKLFRRDQGNVTDFESFKNILRSNNYKTDPYSNGNPGNAICARFDLEKDPHPGGCYDTKVTSSELVPKIVGFAINGPTTQNSLPPFDWSIFNGSYPHAGQPEIFDFDFVVMDPEW